jgi:alcohol dehydrogenase
VTNAAAISLTPQLEPIELHLPPVVLFGRGAAERVGPTARGYSATALVVTDRGLASSSIVASVAASLRAAGVEPLVYDGVEPNPTIAHVEAALAAGSGREVGVIISVGGGSAHDCAKTVALVAANGGEVRDFEGLDRSPHRGLPMICVNTTAGSGADVSRFSVITDPERRTKMVIADRHLMPRVAINDPLLTVGMPAAVTMATGIDALTHGIEAYVSTRASELTDLAALRAVELIGRYLARAVDDGHDLEAREGMLLAALLAGIGIDSASVGATHALAHPLGGRFDLPHGVCNGLLLPVIVEHNLDAAADRYARVAERLGVAGGARALARGLRALGRRVGLPTGLGVLGVTEDQIPELVPLAMADFCMATNPRHMTEADVARCYRAAL